jgi:hypothetical protein
MKTLRQAKFGVKRLWLEEQEGAFAKILAVRE